MCATVTVVGQTADLSALLGLSGAARGVLSFVLVLAASSGLLARREEDEREHPAGRTRETEQRGQVGGLADDRGGSAHCTCPSVERNESLSTAGPFGRLGRQCPVERE